MLKQLKFKSVGPAPELEITFRERLNFLVGDNGLGKTFLLDVAWWALTRTWARGLVVPHLPPAKPSIAYEYETKSGTTHSHQSAFDRATESWSLKASRPPIPGLVVYAQVDGGFSAWDPARNYWKKENPERPASYVFTATQVWEGDKDRENDAPQYIGGLIEDWVLWQLEDQGKADDAFTQLKNALRALSPSPTELLEPGAIRRKVTLDDHRRHPTLKMPHGQEVPLIHASAGMRRVVALAYILVWTWQEHVAASELRGEPPAKEIIFLVDEVEAHLHPEWQRRIVPALLNVMEALTGEHDVKVQLITATHSPMVLASTESSFDPGRDAIWELDRVGDQVNLSLSPWRRHGDASAWLTSSAFDLKLARSIEAETALLAALALLREPAADPSEVERVDRLLRASLSDVDRFWLRWSAYRTSRLAAS